MKKTAWTKRLGRLKKAKAMLSSVRRNHKRIGRTIKLLGRSRWSRD